MYQLSVIHICKHRTFITIQMIHLHVIFQCIHWLFLIKHCNVPCTNQFSAMHAEQCNPSTVPCMFHIHARACKFELARMPLIAVGICHYQSMRFKSETSEIMFEIQITCMLIIYKHQSNNPSWLTVIRCAVQYLYNMNYQVEPGRMDIRHEKGLL